MSSLIARKEAAEALKKALKDDEATFKDGQWEAIDKIINHNKKLLVVQKTGWGKSVVYFLATKFHKDQKKGVTLIISPLLALMRNQVQSAKNIGLVAVTINSSNDKDENSRIQNQILNNEIDVLLISPEKLANEDFLTTILLPISKNIGLFVIDEAHCISDWGHDFRPDYKRIVSILKHLPPNVPVLATTATANDRVIADIENQLGNIETIRGGLIRESLALQNIILHDESSRLAWLSQYIPTLDGSGIVYVLTKRDARVVSDWLRGNGISAEVYYSGSDEGDDADEISREELEEQLLKNQLKVLVATSALGMGFDKPDLGFVIHYQTPSSIVTYYQQVGRAGRAIDYAVGILMSGREDEKIQKFFRESSFPSKENIWKIINALEMGDGLSKIELQKNVNIKSSEIEKVLKFLNVENNPPVFKDGSKWKRTTHDYRLDEEKIQFLIGQKEGEWQEIQHYLRSDGCLMRHLANSLNDRVGQDCGKCANCLNKEFLPSSVDFDTINKASIFLKTSDIIFKPRRQAISAHMRAGEGRILSRWADAGWGQMVADDKHANFFREELVDAMVDMIKNRWKPDPFPTWITYIPSLRHPTLVPDYAKRLSEKLSVKFVDCVKKVKQNEPQKMQHNSYMQRENLSGVFEVDESLVLDESLFLFDDIIDSRWTVTVIAEQLRQAGSGEVLPIALSTAAMEA
jgi:ATP-dependent DNA helicase RecQ